MLGLIKAGMTEGFLKCLGQVWLQGYLSSISSIGFMSLWKAPGKEKENPTSIRVREICNKLCNSRVEIKNPRKERENPLSSSFWGPLFYPQDGVQGRVLVHQHTEWRQWTCFSLIHIFEIIVINNQSGLVELDIVPMNTDRIWYGTCVQCSISGPFCGPNKQGPFCFWEDSPLLLG